MLRKNPSGHLPQVSPLAYIDPTAIICGRVIVEDFVYVGPYAVIRADELNAAIVAKVRQDRREDRDVGHRCEVGRRERHERPDRHIPDLQRYQRQRTKSEGRGKERKPVHRRPPRRQRGVEAEDRHRDHEQKVAEVEIDRVKRREVAAHQNQQHAETRHEAK